MYADLPQLGRGPFGNAIRIVKETDPEFRPFLFVPRSRLHDPPLDIKGTGKSVTVVVWAIRDSGNHALAGIWHEGTDTANPTSSWPTRMACSSSRSSRRGGDPGSALSPSLSCSQLRSSSVLISVCRLRAMGEARQSEDFRVFPKKPVTFLWLLTLFLDA
jgi:hypothetical protein